MPGWQANGPWRRTRRRAPDIYHWRFGPRSTTKRNLDYYFWAWSAPESIPFGNQVQDGGGCWGSRITT